MGERGEKVLAAAEENASGTEERVSMSAELIRKMEKRCFRCMKPLSAPGAVCSCGYDNLRRGNGPGFLPDGVLNGRYYVGGVIGRGGFGVTYIGFDMVNNCRVAIKEYFPDELVNRRRNSGDIYIKDPSQDYLFQQGKAKAISEVKTLMQLRDLENVVNVYEAIQENNTVYIVMEYIDGPALNKYVERNGAMDPETALDYIAAVAGAVSQMQERFGLCHGDISPDNIMLRSGKGGWTPVLVDFGTVQKVQDEIATVEAKVAKQYYSAPELLNSNGRINNTTDGFSLCVTLYYLLAGRIRKTTIDRYIEELPSLTGQGVRISPGIEKVIMKGMALEKDDRYRDAGALLKALKEAIKKDKKYLAKDGTNSGKPKSNKRLVIVIAALVAVAAAVVLAVLPHKAENTNKPDLTMVMKNEGMVLSWDAPDAETYDICLRSSDGSSPVRYNKTRVENIMIPRSNLESGLRFELEVTAYYKNGSSITVSEGFDVG